MDIYKTLGVSRTATLGQIQEAYRKLAVKHHPDKNQGREKEATELFKKVQDAFEQLSDPLKRAEWDRKHPAQQAKAPNSNQSKKPKDDPFFWRNDPNLGNCRVPEAPTHDIWGNKLTAEERAAWVASASGGPMIYPAKKKYIKPEPKKKPPRDNSYFKDNHFVDNGSGSWVDSQKDSYHYDDDQPNIR